MREDLNKISYAVIGAAMEVHRNIGPGFLESIYEEALCVELEPREIPFVRQAPIQLAYKGRMIGEGRVDILVANQVIVELKAVETLIPIHTAQIMSYLKASNLELGLLINFNVKTRKDSIHRIVNKL